VPDSARSKPREDRRVAHVYAWQRHEETQAERDALLAAASARISERVRAHLDAGASPDLLVIAAPPGVGKSTAVSQLGAVNPVQPGRHARRRQRGTRGQQQAAYIYDLAWIAERREMVDSLHLDTLGYHIIAPCRPDNCTEHERHTAGAQSGRTATAVLESNEQQGIPCDYRRQFRRGGSAVYQLAHVPTHYPARHRDGIISLFGAKTPTFRRGMKRRFLSDVPLPFDRC
jgi:hypothetical protein